MAAGVSRVRPPATGRAPLPTGFASLWLAVAVDATGFGIVIPILPLYAEAFQVSPTMIGVLLASFSLAQFVAAPRWGRISDRFGRKPALLASLAGSALGALLTAVAPNLTILFIGRIIDGASGGSLTIAQAIAGDVARPEERTRLLGLLGAAFGLGFVAGPAIGGLAALAGQRIPFLVAALLTTANTALAAHRLVETHPGGRRAREPQRTTRNRGPVSLLVVAFLCTVAFGAFETTFALLGARRLGLTVTGASLVFVAAGALVALANARLAAPAARRLGDLGALRLGLILDAAGLALLGVASSRSALGVAVVALAVGHGLVLPTLASTITTRVSEEHRGAALGSQQAAASLARVAGPLIAGATFGLLGPAAAFFTAAVAASWAAAMTRRTRTEPVLGCDGQQEGRRLLACRVDRPGLLK